MTKRSPFASRDTIIAGLKELNDELRRQNVGLLSENNTLRKQNAWLARMCDELVATMRTGATEGNWPRKGTMFND